MFWTPETRFERLVRNFVSNCVTRPPVETGPSNSMSAKSKSESAETILTHAGRYPGEQHGFVNTPVSRGSTVLFSTLDEFEKGKQHYRYARRGTPNSRSVEEVITALEHADGTVLAPSGLAAVTTALLSALKPGDELLMTDSAYQPTRHFCETVLKKMGIKTRYYDPAVGGGIAELVTPGIAAVFIESPGSLTFEMQDLRAIVEAAHAHKARVLVDNTWATPLYHQPLLLGADIVIHAGTKMIVGHSDAMFGIAAARGDAWNDLRRMHGALGMCASPDDCFLAARGLRTLALRMKEHSARSIDLAAWLASKKPVVRVRHPALPGDPGHEIFSRDFSGAGSLFGLELAPASRDAVAAMLDGMKLFGMGFSWGGFESLIIPANPAPARSAVPWNSSTNLFRLHIGFEDIDDLKQDLEEGLKRYLSLA